MASLGELLTALSYGLLNASGIAQEARSEKEERQFYSSEADKQRGFYLDYLSKQNLSAKELLDISNAADIKIAEIDRDKGLGIAKEGSEQERVRLEGVKYGADKTLEGIQAQETGQTERTGIEGRLTESIVGRLGAALGFAAPSPTTSPAMPTPAIGAPTVLGQPAQPPPSRPFEGAGFAVGSRSPAEREQDVIGILNGLGLLPYYQKAADTQGITRQGLTDIFTDPIKLASSLDDLFTKVKHPQAAQIREALVNAAMGKAASIPGVAGFPSLGSLQQPESLLGG